MTPAARVPSPLEPGELPPKEVAWLHPGQLLRTAYHVWLSTVAKEYIDRRETLAALDAVRAINRQFPNITLEFGNASDAAIPRADHGRDIWIDFVADIGDSWNATYAVANLIARPKLEVRGHDQPLDSAAVVVLGGDLIYPTPSRDGYRRRMRSPFFAARPANKNGRAPCLLAIPGNHDWYDGLTNFVREFCQGDALGGWQMVQRRSYFHVKLAHHWWLFGIDIALDTRIDPPQQAYFLNLLLNRAEFEVGDNVILCTAKPAWLDKDKPASAAYRNLSYFVREIIENRGKGCVRIILSGDLHNYSRYENPAHDQLITAGGGGAYLQGTHHLPRQVPDLSARRTDVPDPPCHETGFEYPCRSDSRRLALRTLLLAFRPANLAFTATVGLLYWLFAATLQVAQPRLLDQPLSTVPLFLVRIALSPAASVAFVIVMSTLVMCAIVAAASNSAASRLRTVPWGVMHGFLHLAMAVVVAWAIQQYYASDQTLVQWLPRDGRAFRIAISLTRAVIGGFVGATLVGMYFVLSDFLFGWHTNEVFVAQSIINYRNFIRMRLCGDGSIVLYPIGVRDVPRKWRFALKREAHDPHYEPADRVLTAHLIEGPITITRRDAPRVAD
jgi:hypothetical protein